MKYYLIDTENVGSDWIRLIEKAKAKDRFVLFWTKNSPRVTYQDLQTITDPQIQMEAVQFHTGQNALDFQLVSYMGHILNKRAKAQFIIVSKDHGYDPVAEFWSEKGYNVSRNSLTEYEKDAVVESVMGDAPKEEIDVFVNIMNKAKTKGQKEVKAYVHGQLVKAFGPDTGLARYNAVKKRLEDYYAA